MYIPDGLWFWGGFPQKDTGNEFWSTKEGCSWLYWDRWLINGVESLYDRLGNWLLVCEEAFAVYAMFSGIKLGWSSLCSWFFEVAIVLCYFPAYAKTQFCQPFLLFTRFPTSIPAVKSLHTNIPCYKHHHYVLEFQDHPLSTAYSCSYALYLAINITFSHSHKLSPYTKQR